MNRQTITTSIVTLALGIAIGSFWGTFWSGNTPDNGTSGVEAPKEKKAAYWVAPMDPNYRRDKPGKSPMGMDLIPVYEGEEGNSTDVGFTINPNVLANLGVKTSKVTFAAFVDGINATGQIMYDETLTSRVHMRTEGWVEKLVVRAVGDEVNEGDLLFTFYSPNLANALSEYGQTLKSNSSRLKSLAISRLKALGLEDRTIKAAQESGDWTAPISVFAPSTGVVTKLGVREGSLSAKNTIAFEITNPKNMWLIIDVFESQAHDVMVGQKVTVAGLEANSEVYVDYIYPELDPKLQTVRVRINIPNEGRNIKTGQYFDAFIKPKSIDLLTVPTSAVIRLGSGNRVILSHGDGQFEAAEVFIGASANGRTVISAGLSEGESVVTSGQFMLDSESSFNGAALRMADKVKMTVMEKPQPTVVETIVTVMGTINSVNVEGMQVNITHGEIREIGWPVMTMDFDVVNTIDLAAIKAPTKVHFGIGKNADGMYVVTSIHIIAAGKGEPK
jgi:Cu(I)/Ag(I) efflux system membrane fusion protein